MRGFISFTSPFSYSLKLSAYSHSQADEVRQNIQNISDRLKVAHWHIG